MDWRVCAALENRTGKRRNFAIGRMVDEIVLVNSKARERLQVVGVNRTRQHVECGVVVRRVVEQEQVVEQVRLIAREVDVVDAVETQSRPHGRWH